MKNDDRLREIICVANNLGWISHKGEIIIVDVKKMMIAMVDDSYMKTMSDWNRKYMNFKEGIKDMLNIILKGGKI